VLKSHRLLTLQRSHHHSQRRTRACSRFLRSPQLPGRKPASLRRRLTASRTKYGPPFTSHLPVSFCCWTRIARQAVGCFARPLMWGVLTTFVCGGCVMQLHWPQSSSSVSDCPSSFSLQLGYRKCLDSLASPALVTSPTSPVIRFAQLSPGRVVSPTRSPVKPALERNMNAAPYCENVSPRRSDAIHGDTNTVVRVVSPVKGAVSPRHAHPPTHTALYPTPPAGMPPRFLTSHSGAVARKGTLRKVVAQPGQPKLAPDTSAMIEKSMEVILAIQNRKRGSFSVQLPSLTPMEGLTVAEAPALADIPRTVTQLRQDFNMPFSRWKFRPTS
jgi:hypothetical protein